MIKFPWIEKRKTLEKIQGLLEEQKALIDKYNNRINFALRLFIPKDVLELLFQDLSNDFSKHRKKIDSFIESSLKNTEK